jgi:hypothetical protein
LAPADPDALPKPVNPSALLEPADPFGALRFILALLSIHIIRIVISTVTICSTSDTLKTGLPDG